MKKILRHKLLSSIFFAGILLVLGGWLWAFFALRGIQEPLILHWNSFAGITDIGGLGEITKLGMLGLMMNVLDLFVALEIKERDNFWGGVLASGALAMSVLIFLGFAAIISVN